MLEALLRLLYPPFCSHCNISLPHSSLLFCSHCLQSVEQKNPQGCCGICYQTIRGAFCCPPKLLSESICCFEKNGAFETLITLVKTSFEKRRFAQLIASLLLLEMEKRGVLGESVLLIPFDSLSSWQWARKKGVDSVICSELASLYSGFSVIYPYYKSVEKMGEGVFSIKAAKDAEKKVAFIVSLEHPRKKLLREFVEKLLYLPWKKLSLVSFC